MAVTAFVVNSEVALQSALGEIRAEWQAARYLKITTKGRGRSLNQNDLSHTWYEQLARELREDDALGWKCYAKLHHGVPILRADEPEFRAAYDSVIRPLTYEQKLEAMKFWPVTSLMSKSQLSKYLEAVQGDFAKRGVTLEFPQERAA